MQQEMAINFASTTFIKTNPSLCPFDFPALVHRLLNLTTGDRQYTDQVHWATRLPGNDTTAIGDTDTSSIPPGSLVGMVSLAHQNITQIIRSIAARNGENEVWFNEGEEAGSGLGEGVPLSGKDSLDLNGKVSIL